MDAGTTTAGAGGAVDEFPTGCRVEVRNHYLATWSRGFEVAIRTPTGYIVRRRSDQTLLPEVFHDEEVRRAGPESAFT